MRRVAVLLMGSLALPSIAAAQPGTPAVLREVGFEQKLGGTLPLETTFRDETGRAVRLGDYFEAGRPVVLSLVYYECPMLCTLSLNGLVSALKTLAFTPGTDFELLTVSFDASDGPEAAAAKKQAYLREYGRPEGAGGWHFLTGDAAAVKALAEAVGFRYTWDERTRQFAHPSGVMVLTPEGRLARYLYGIEYAPKDLRFALVESAAGRIGTVLDQVVLYCYQYDPETGRYGAAVMRILRAAAALTVVALAAFIGVMVKRERSAR